MSLVPPINNEVLKLTKFIDFDKDKSVFYNNLYLEDYKVVIKIPLINKDDSKKDIKIKEFDLTKYTYLLSYD